MARSGPVSLSGVRRRGFGSCRDTGPMHKLDHDTCIGGPAARRARPGADRARRAPASVAGLGAEAVRRPQLAMVESQPSGVRLVFRTRATAIELDTRADQAGLRRRTAHVRTVCTTYSSTAGWSTQAQRTGGNVLTIDHDHRRHPDSARCSRKRCVRRAVRRARRPSRSGCRTTRRPNSLPCAPMLRSSRPPTRAPSLAAPRQLDQPRFERRPARPDVAGAARRTRPVVEPINLGFGGSALLAAVHRPDDAGHARRPDQHQARHQRGQRDVMRLRAFAPAVHGFLDTIRDGHPTTPLLVVSPVLCPIHEDTPGPTHAGTSTALSSRRLRFRATGDPADIPAGKAHPDGHPRRARPDRRRNAPDRPATCTTSTAASCTARPTTPSSHFPTTSTPTARPTN